MCELGLLQRADLSISLFIRIKLLNFFKYKRLPPRRIAMTDAREHALRVWVTPEEKAVIYRHAESTSMSCSRYLRTLGIGYVPRSTLDSSQMLDLVRANANLARLGGLLKMLLTNQERRTPELCAQIDNLLNEMVNGQRDLRAIADKLKK